MSTPTSHTLDRLRREGWTPSVVERWLPYARVRQDCLGFADVLAVREDTPGVLFCQCCTTGDQSKRLRKLMDVPAVRVALLGSNKVEVWGWHKSKRTGRWEVTRRSVSLADLDAQHGASVAEKDEATPGGMRSRSGATGHVDAAMGTRRGEGRAGDGADDPPWVLPEGW